MSIQTHFLHSVTGLDPSLIVGSTRHFHRRVSFLGAIMVFTAFFNGALLTISLGVNGFSAITAIAAGAATICFTYLVERFIVTSTQSLTGADVTYRLFMVLSMIGLHLIFVDLAVYRADIIPIAIDHHEEQKQDDAEGLNIALDASLAEIKATETRIDAQRVEFSIRQERPLLEATGKGATGQVGSSTMTKYEEEEFEKYRSTIYMPDSTRLANQLVYHRKQADSIQALITAIAVRPFDYDAIGLTTKLTYLHEFSKQPGNESVPFIMLLLAIIVLVIEMAPLYARHRLEFKEYQQAYQQKRAFKDLQRQEKTRLAMMAEQLRGEAIDAAAAERQRYTTAEQKAEDRFAYAQLQVAFLKRTEMERAGCLQDFAAEEHPRVHEVFNKLRYDLALIFNPSTLST
ncbi:hypothetical protein QWY85_14390 [Neolewinella lacunae]|uniref:DUF4407 domain-containing protein n=1 Tax=Neolewinella lacunae TaxID=1517758 RepID=A0A923PKN0_9BACT|nr:hypothetical protein [Neolewinella lacunae]MBC6993034.1 hypothetical protein [Neolewinella lacunae]MDN3635856.1 hypothetical protein [Neolewinella lacunae]